MTSETDMGLIALPLTVSIFAVLLQNPLYPIFAVIGSLALAGAAAALTQLAGINIFGSGVDVKDFSLRLAFTTTFLTGFYTLNLILGINMLASIPFGIGIILTGVVTTMYVFGIFGMVTG